VNGAGPGVGESLAQSRRYVNLLESRPWVCSVPVSGCENSTGLAQGLNRGREVVNTWAEIRPAEV